MSDASVSAQPLAGATVLIVEDEWMISLSLQAALEEAGACVIEIADCVASAERILRAGEAFDVAVLDLHLRDGDARSLIELFSVRAIPFVVTTGDTAAADLKLGTAIAVLGKPFRSEDLVDALRRSACH